MGIAPHPGLASTGATFELERLELDDGRLVVRGWWFGVRGVRFVRPGLIVGGRQVALATLEHKPWAAEESGAWIAAFPWKRRGLDVAGVTLVVAPSIEVPLDRDADGWPERGLELESAPAPDPERAAGRIPTAPDRERAAGTAPAAPATVVEEIREPLRDELAGIERQLDSVHAELREARAAAAQHEARCRELEGVAARERRAAAAAETADEELMAAHAMAVLDRDRALAQHAEAVADREAAVRARSRMERQRDEAVAARDVARTGRAEALAERDEARRQRDELGLAHEALQAQLKGEWAHDAGADTETRPLRAPPQKPAGAVRAREEAGPDAPIGVRTIPAARTVAASLHRSKREREHAVTQYDMWAIRILGSVAALAFISLLVMILKAFFVF